MGELAATLKRAFPNIATIGERGEPFIDQMIDKSASDPTVTEKITVGAHEWNGTTKQFEYDEGLSIAFEQEEEKLLMPGLQP